MNEWNAETAEWYARKYGEYETNRFAVEALDLGPDSDVVDVGCGTGCALRHASERVTRGSLIGVDPVPRMIEIARERAVDHAASARLDFRQGSAEALPVGDDSADFVFVFDSFEHWQDRDVGLREVRRVLRAKGRLVVVRDGAVPGRTKVSRVLCQEIESAGFEILEEGAIERGGVAFALWIATPRAAT